MAQNEDTGHAADRWDFDGEVTRVFDDMLARSIPEYPTMRDAVFRLAQRFARPDRDVLDLGCSRGESIARLVACPGGLARRFIGVEKSPPMLQAARERFSGEIESGRVAIVEDDLRTGFCFGFEIAPAVVTSVLTLQFVPIEYRQGIISHVYEMLSPGGALIIVEKVLGTDGPVNEALTSIYYDMKREHGYDNASIERKRLSLEGVLVPITAKWNEELLQRAGFAYVDCFWRWMNFAGWLALKK